MTYVWTHDSVGLGEDGPTHQPVEQPAALRAIPNLWYVRPGDANEAVAAWALAIERRDGPVALGLTRQKLTTLPETAEAARDGVRRGGYVLRESSGGADGIDLLLVATGSELGLAAAARDALEADGIRTRLVSLPCFAAFERQDEAYRDSVLPRAARKRLTVEAGVTLGWDRYAGADGAMIGIDHFGASAPGPTVFEHFGFTPGARRRRRPAGRPGRAPRPDPDPRSGPPAGRPGPRPAGHCRVHSGRLGGLMRVAFAADHGGAALKDELLARLSGRARQPARADRPGWRRLGPDRRLSRLCRPARPPIQRGEADRGVLVCGSGVGASVAASKMTGIRASVCHDTYSAHQGVEHDDMNVLCLGGRIVGIELALEIVRAYLGADLQQRASPSPAGRQGPGDRSSRTRVSHPRRPTRPLGGPR